MEKPYIVDFIPVMEEGSALSVTVKPRPELVVAGELEALLIERDKQGYEFVQMTLLEREPTAKRHPSGLLSVFRKKQT